MRKRVRSTALGVVESRVAKHTSEDTQGSGVQFIMPEGPRGISSQQGPWCFWEAQFYGPCFVTGYMLATSLLYMTEFYNKQVLGEQTIKVEGGKQWLYIKAAMSPWLI